MKDYTLNILDYIFNNFSQGTAYLIIAIAFIFFGILYGVTNVLSMNDADKEKKASEVRKIKLKNLLITLLAIAGLMVIGYFFIPVFSQWIWNYGQAGR